ncbi:acyltransferase [Gammaproteobacteria bacterium]|nr:acyltransferase [Gammaproteobacteria bacterium]MDA8798899.1 acyltransferase [Gammaproteobacteria bacterium]MDC0919406.1 acyltransferase [Gammaproteobacteria bacterium]
MNSIKYRKEIDGLRAIAVLPVIFFHAGFSVFKGGFSGVDIFFVISGYLITSIILKECIQNNFSVLNFYERRARRILPALFLVMLLCLPLSFILLWPNDLENFGQSLVATTLFSNNILLFFTSTDYWSLSAEFKPLLHTWSLGVEEQYYLVFPLLMILIWPLKINKIFFILLLLSILSFFLSVYLSSIPEFKTINFYLLPSRFWELLAGSMCAIYLIDKTSNNSISLIWKNILSGLGLSVIFFAFFVLDESLNQDFLMLLPVIGTVLIILFTEEKTFVGKFLSLKPMIYIGLISFSLYLWHQPIYAFLRAYSLESPSSFAYVLCIFLVFGLASLSYKLEVYFRDWEKVPSKLFYLLSSGVASFIVLTGLSLHFSSGFYSKYDSLKPEFNDTVLTNINSDDLNERNKISVFSRKYFLNLLNKNNKNAEYVNEPFRYLNREFDNPERKNLVIFGDSFARDFINMGTANNYFRDYELSFINYNCYESTQSIKPSYPESIHQADMAIISYRILDNADDLVCLKNQVLLLKELGIRFYIIGTKDFGYNMNAPFKRKMYEWKATISDEIHTFNNLMNTIYPNQYIDLINLTSQDKKVSLYTKNKKFISSDGHHLTKSGARVYGKALFSIPELNDLR